MKKTVVFFALAFMASDACSSNLRITNFDFQRVTDGKDMKMWVILTVSWDNAWNNQKNNDAAWLYFKLRHQNDTRNFRSAPVKPAGHKLLYNYLNNGVSPAFYVPGHQAGVIVCPSKSYRGNVSWRIQIELDLNATTGINFNNTIFGDVFGIEMVRIPTDSFYLGDSDTAKQNGDGALFNFSDKERFLVNSEAAIQVGKEKGSLYYSNNEQPEYRGDVAGPIPDSFPKGFKSFYIMKYEMTQGQYTAFLNTLSNQASSFRAGFGGKEFSVGRGSVKIENGVYKTNHPDRPANYTSWDDGCAFADWAGLRPVTELEFEKAARGPNRTGPGDYPWGTSNADLVSRYYDDNGDLVLENPLNESKLNDSNLALYGASYYWVMDLSGSLWERVISIGSPKGRSFKGSHGDGMVDGFGNATNSDWANEDEGGLGYRGGGTYDRGMAFGPSHTFISQRRYGAWGDGPRSVAYGFRAALTIEQ